MLRILSEWTLDIDKKVGLYMLHWQAEGIWPCKVGQVYVRPKGRLYQLVQKMTDQQIVQGSEC